MATFQPVGHFFYISCIQKLQKGWVLGEGWRISGWVPSVKPASTTNQRAMQKLKLSVIPKPYWKAVQYLFTIGQTQYRRSTMRGRPSLVVDASWVQAIS